MLLSLDNVSVDIQNFKRPPVWLAEKLQRITRKENSMSPSVRAGFETVIADKKKLSKWGSIEKKEGVGCSHDHVRYCLGVSKLSEFCMGDYLDATAEQFSANFAAATNAYTGG